MLAITDPRVAGILPAPVNDISILSVATAVPRYVMTQDDVAERARTVWPQFNKLERLFANTGIERRHVSEAPEWYLQTHSWEERSEFYYSHALDLLERAARDAVAAAGLAIGDIDMLVVNTITGVAVPSLDARLINRVGFRSDVERLPIFGFGCGGGVAGLSRAAQPCPRHARRQRAFPDGRPVLALPAHRRSEHRNVRIGVAFRRRGGRCRAARRARRAGNGGRVRRALLRRASICGRAPSASWAGT